MLAHLSIHIYLTRNLSPFNYYSKNNYSLTQLNEDVYIHLLQKYYRQINTLGNSFKTNVYFGNFDSVSLQWN